jgi:hypothetical protein
MLCLAMCKLPPGWTGFGVATATLRVLPPANRYAKSLRLIGPSDSRLVPRLVRVRAGMRWADRALVTVRLCCLGTLMLVLAACARPLAAPQLNVADTKSESSVPITTPLPVVPAVPSPTPTHPAASSTAALPILRPLGFRGTTASTPTAITDPPPFAGTELFATPNEPAYVQGQGFAPDARRVLDIASLQVSLERYRAARGRYPATLAELFPSFAPREQGQALTVAPVDPQTHQPYTYMPSADGASYQLSATLDSGRSYSGVQRALH